MSYNQTSLTLAGRIAAYEVIKGQCEHEIKQLRGKLEREEEFERCYNPLSRVLKEAIEGGNQPLIDLIDYLIVKEKALS